MSNSKRSIGLGVRLITIIVVVVTIILSGIGAYQYSRTKALYTALVDEGLNAACIRLSNNLSAPLWNFNKEQVSDVLRSEMAQEALVGIVVRMGSERKVFSGISKLSAGNLKPIEDEAGLPSNARWRSFDVVWEGATIATGTVYFTLDSLNQTLHAQITSMVVQTIVTDLLLIALIGVALSRIVIGPVGALTNIADALATGGLSREFVERAITSLDNLAKRLRRDELSALTSTFTHMLQNLSSRDAELEEHRKNLELLVAERTVALTKRNEQMRLVLDNVAQGLVLVSPDGSLSDERSAAFERFFGNSATKVDVCLFDDPKVRAFFRLGYEQLSDGFLPVDLVLDQLPKQARRGDAIFGLRYRPLMEGEQCTSVLFMIDDITSELAAQKKDREQFEQIRVFERCMRDKNGFLEFFNETGKMVDRVGEDRFSSVEERLRIIHTIKGNASLFDVLSVTEVAHALETAVIEEEADAIVEHRASLVQVWDAFAQRVSTLFRDRTSERYELSRKDLDSIIASLKSGEATSQIVRQLVALTYEPIKLRFTRVEEQLRALASRLQKAPVECVIEGDRLRLPPDQLAPFWAVFPHVVRNIADHGFEAIEERQARGKPLRNRVTLSAVADERGIEIQVADDGRGIAWDRVRARAERLGMAHATRQDLINALFSPGFSTAETVSAISGRGVGLSAVAVAVSEVNGSVNVESEPGTGTQFRFSFPPTEATDVRSSIIPLSMAPLSVPPAPWRS